MTPELGVIEGYFGRAWSWPERRRVVDLLAAGGYGYFHYAPKADAKLRREWRKAFNEPELGVLSEFAQHCRIRGMRFGVGLTPFEAHLSFDRSARRDLRAKLRQLAGIGLDDLVVMFDDMEGRVANLAQRQAEIVGECIAAGAATRYFTVPSYYSDDPVLDRVFGTRPAHYLRDLGKALPQQVAVYWTGEEVCSLQYSSGHLARVAEELGRKVAIWDNYPVNDGPRKATFLHLRAFTGRPPSIRNQVTHHAVNPLSQPLLGCVPALTLPLCYGLGDRYEYSAAFREAARNVLGSDLAAMLVVDLPVFQDVGLAAMTGQDRERLVSRYGDLDHPAAREILDWLGGIYAITGEAVMTQ